MKILKNIRIIDERIILLINLLSNEIGLTLKDAEEFSLLLDKMLNILKNNVKKDD